MDNETMLVVQNELEKINLRKPVIAIHHICEAKISNCELCTAFHNRVFKLPEDREAIPQLPLHPNCKCKQIEIRDEAVYKKLTQVDSATVRVDNSPGFGGIRISGIEDMLEKLEKKYPNGGIERLIISNHGNSPGYFPLGNNDDLKFIANNPKYLECLKKLLAKDAMIDIRMCHAVEGKSGAQSAQKLADILGVKILGYEGPVSPFGTRPNYAKNDKEHYYGPFGARFPDNKPKIFLPQKHE